MKEISENKMKLENRRERLKPRNNPTNGRDGGKNRIGEITGRNVQRCVSVQVREYRGRTAIDSLGTRMDHQSPDNLYLLGNIDNDKEAR